MTQQRNRSSPSLETRAFPLLEEVLSNEFVSLFPQPHRKQHPFCSSSRPEELPKLALVIQEGPDGQAVHSWQPADEFQMKLQSLHCSVSRKTLLGERVIASSCRRDCDKEQIECHRNCMRRKLPAPLNYIPRGHPRHNRICRDNCLRAYNDCVDAEKARALRFSAVEGAVEWLKEHRTQLLIGTVAVLAGVTFVVVSAGAGLLVLVPLSLMASADGGDAPLCRGGAQ